MSLDLTKEYLNMVANISLLPPGNQNVIHFQMMKIMFLCLSVLWTNFLLLLANCPCAACTVLLPTIQGIKTWVMQQMGDGKTAV